MPFKTLGPQSARLVTALYEENRPVFRVGDVQRILTMKEDTARSFVRKWYRLTDKGNQWLNRGVKSGSTHSTGDQS